MNNIVISVEHLFKAYHLGQIGSGTLSHDLSAWWAKARGKPNPYQKIGETGHGNRDGETIWALEDINFSVEQGEVLGIIGRNGAGKSTLLKILSRVTAPTAGKIKVRGRLASLLEVGTGFHPDLTGSENIYLNGAILGMSRNEIGRKFDEIVAFAEIEKFIDTPVKHYSSGMYVRLAFAVAAHLDPEILVVDEVLAVGDAEFQRKCLGKMDDVAKQGRTVLFVSHNMSSIQKLCTKGILLREGKLLMYSDIADCVTTYLNPFNENNKTILSQIILLKPFITLTTIEVNGNTNNIISLDDRTNELIFEIVGRVDQPTRMELEIRITDNQGAPLGFYSPGHEKGFSKKYHPGKFRILQKMKLPRMNKGEYILNISLTDPGIETIVEIPNAVKIDFSGTRTATGWVFEYRSLGWLLLQDSSED